MTLLKLAQKPQETETMPTLNDVYKLAESADRRLDAMEEKLDALHAEVSVAVGALMEHFQGK